MFEKHNEYRFDKCYTCVYKRPVPGNAHISCGFDWKKGLLDDLINVPPMGIAHGIQNGWYEFPVLFDPTWMAVPCQAYSNDIAYHVVKEHDGSKFEMLMEIRSRPFTGRVEEDTWLELLEKMEE